MNTSPVTLIDGLVKSQLDHFSPEKRKNLSLRASATISIVSGSYEIASSASLPRNDRVDSIGSR